MDCSFVDFDGDLDMKRVVAKFIVLLLSEEQKKCHDEVAVDLLENANSAPYFIKQVTTGDKSWIYGYDPETNAHSSNWKSPLALGFESVTNVEVMMTVGFFIMKVLFTMSMFLQARQ